MDREQMEHWIEVSKCNRQARRMADRHYTHLSKIFGAAEIGGNGQKIVFLTRDSKAVWGSHRPAPWAKIKRADGLEGLFCFLYRNEGYQAAKSSDLIREAVSLTAIAWGVADFWTYIGVEHIESTNPGYCYLNAGFEHHKWGHSQKLGKLRLLKMTEEEVQKCLEEYVTAGAGLFPASAASAPAPPGK